MSLVTTVSQIQEGPALWNADALSEDRRSAPRITRDSDTQLVCPRGGEVVRCSVRDLSEGGLFVYAPPGSKLTVGQRFEVVLGAEPATGTFGEGLYATVVRTETVVNGDQHMLGAGMRFDQPFFF